MKCAPSEELALFPSSPLSLHPSDKSSVDGGRKRDCRVEGGRVWLARVPGLS